MRNYTAIFLIFTAFCISAFAVSGRMPKVQSANFSEVEISLDENFTLANALALPRAPGSQVQVLDDGRKVKTQLPQRTLRGLIDTGADVNVTRNFILMQAAANDTESDEITPADSSPAYGEKDDNITIPYNDWAYSDISFYSYPSELLVTTVDVHYRVYGSSGYMYLDFGDEDFDVFTYVLLDYEYSGGGLLTDTVTGITDFFGKPVSQYWILWAYEQYGDGSGWIDYWWLKLYYDQGGYCFASGECAEYIARVQVGSIDKTSDCENYSDYTDLSTSMQIGTGYNITVTNGVTEYDTDECGIWVDWNQDEDFYDAGEQINVSDSPGVGPYTATITPPPGAVLGDTRMRIRIVDGYYDSLDACGSSSYGEVEDYTITVTSGPGTIRLGGYIETTADDPMSDIEVTAVGADSDTTDVNGYYEIEVEAPYSGAVEILDPPQNWFFMPASYVLSNQTTDRLDMDFIAVYTGPDSITVRGYVTTSEGYGMRDTLIEASTGQSTYCDSGGFYELTVSVGDPEPVPWSGTITPSRDYWGFVPASHNYSSLAADINDQNFIGSYTADPHPTISGYVKTAGGTPVKNVQVALDDMLNGGITMTDENGYYELSPPYYDMKVPMPWSCTIEPAKTDWTFSPPNNVYTDLAFDVTDQNYIAAYVGTGCDGGWLEKYATVLRSNPYAILGDFVSDIAVDDSGNFYLTGTGSGSGTGNDIITIKYNAQGDILWLSRFNGPANKNDNPEKLLLDGFGHLYVVGTSYVDSTFTDCVIIRYPLDSNVPDWTVYYTQMLNTSERAESAALDSMGNIYLLCRDRDYHMRTIKYIPGVNEPDWISQYVAPGYDDTNPIMAICDEADNVYVIGENDLGMNVSEWVTIRYDSKTGTPLWTKTYQYETDSRDMPARIQAFENGNICVTGYSMPADNNDRMVAVVYDKSGNVVDHKRLEDPFGEYGNITFDAQANAYAAGTFGPDNPDIGLIKYLPGSNDISWIGRYDSPEHYSDFLINLFFDEWENIYLLGLSIIDDYQFDIVLLKYVPDSNQPVAIAAYKGPFNNVFMPAMVSVDRSHDVFVAASSLGGFLAVKFSQCCSQSDIDCDYEVGRDDLGYLCDEWLMNKISLDIAPLGGDGSFDFIDWSVFADAWYSQFGQENYSPACDLVPDEIIDELDLEVLLDSWLDTGRKSLWSDIYPTPDGDGVVDIYDFALFAQQWMLKY